MAIWTLNQFKIIKFRDSNKYLQGLKWKKNMNKNLIIKKRNKNKRLKKQKKWKI